MNLARTHEQHLRLVPADNDDPPRVATRIRLIIYQHHLAPAGAARPFMPHEHHIIVERTARYFTIGREDGYAEDIWIVLHGQGQLASDFIGEFEPLNDGNRLIVAPEGLSRYYTRQSTGTVGASWMTTEDRLNEIRDYVDYLDAIANHLEQTLLSDTQRMTVVGYSQGGATASRWSMYGAHVVDSLILWGSGIPPDLNMDLLREKLEGRMELTIVRGSGDEYFTPRYTSAERARLAAESLEPRWIEYDGGHAFNRDILARVVSPSTGV